MRKRMLRISNSSLLQIWAFSFPVAVSSLAQREWLQEQNLGSKAVTRRTLNREKWFLFNPRLVENTETEITSEAHKNTENCICIFFVFTKECYRVKKKSQSRDFVSKSCCITCSFLFPPTEKGTWIFWELYKYTIKQPLSQDFLC